jgi:hypothetical protein
MGTNAAGFRRFCQGFADRENELGSGLNTSFAGFADFADGCEVKNNGGKQERREGGVFFRIFYWICDIHTRVQLRNLRNLQNRLNTGFRSQNGLLPKP